MRDESINSKDGKTTAAKEQRDRRGCVALAACLLVFMVVGLSGVQLFYSLTQDWTESAVQEQKRHAESELDLWRHLQLSAQRRRIAHIEDDAPVDDPDPDRMDPSNFSKGPMVPTAPATIASNNPAAPCSCTLRSPPQHQWARARIFIFQKNGVHQLQTVLHHYRHVLPADSIVVLDHGSTDAWTTQMLNHYGQTGIHVWSCEGDWAHKSTMLTMVMHAYAEQSDFVFPFDVDELLLVPVANEPKAPLTWDTHHFYNALKELDDAKTSGKPFKVEHSWPRPSDCHYGESSHSLNRNASTQQVSTAFFPSPLCEVRYLVREPELRWNCMSKSFARGRDFIQTDSGNHFVTTNYTIQKFPRLDDPLYNVIPECNEQGVEAWFDTANVVLLHAQQLEFSEWMVHALQGASLTTFPATGQCSETEGENIHYCRLVHVLQEHAFNPDELRKLYSAEYCLDLDRPDIALVDAAFGA